MKKITLLVLSLLLAFSLFSCQNQSDDTPVTTAPETENAPTTETSLKTDNSLWYSENADVRGRIWLGMTEKEVYDVLSKYNITFRTDANCDEYGAVYESQNGRYYKKYFDTVGHQFFYFDEDDRLVEVCYFDQMHYTADPVNEEFEAQRGVKRRDTYEDMIKTYGEPDKVIPVGDKITGNETYVYYLENGDYLHFVYQGTNTPIQSIHYCKFPYLFSY